MTTTAAKDTRPAKTTTAARPILAIDLGKYKCVACIYDRSTTAAEFRSIDTSMAEVERLIRRTRPSVVVIEACALAGWVHDLCRELGVKCKVAHTGGEAWKYKHAKRKTDRDDALRLSPPARSVQFRLGFIDMGVQTDVRWVLRSDSHEEPFVKTREQDDRGTCQTSIRHHLLSRGDMRQYAVAPPSHQRCRLAPCRTSGRSLGPTLDLDLEARDSV